MSPQCTWPSYHTFKSAVARDLCWLLSPQFDLSMPTSAYQPFTLEIDNEVIRWLRRIDQQPHLAQVSSAIQSHLPQQRLPQQRLGQYFEDLVVYCLKHKPGAPVYDLQRNLPLRRPSARGKGTETVGELDLLFRQGQRLQHLEVAVKFYLGVSTPSGTHRWLGPNSKDSLDRKWQRLLTHQLPLAQHFVQQENIQSRYWLKGILFDHWQHDSTEYGQPLLHWIHRHQMKEYFQHYGGQWHWLNKRHWLGAYPAEQAAFNITTLQRALRQHFDNNDYGLMLVNASSTLEHRCFVVSDHWPAMPLG